MQCIKKFTLENFREIRMQNNEVCFVATRDYAVNEDDEIGTKIE
jgi:hypothetical protein